MPDGDVETEVHELVPALNLYRLTWSVPEAAYSVPFTSASSGPCDAFWVQVLVAGANDSTVLPEEVLPTAYNTPFDTAAVADARSQMVPAAVLQVADCADAVPVTVSTIANVNNHFTTALAQSRRFMTIMAERANTRLLRLQSISKLNQAKSADRP